MKIFLALVGAGLGLLLLTVFALFTASRREADQVPPIDELSRIELFLGESYERVQGDLGWQMWEGGEPTDLLIYEYPVYVTVHLPAGRVVDTPTRNLFAHQRQGHVDEVVLTPLLEPARYKEAVKEAERWVEQLDVSDSKIGQHLAEWKQQEITAERAPYASGLLPSTEIPGGVTLTVGLQPFIDADAWYVELRFYLPEFDDRILRQATGRRPSGNRPD